MKTALSAESIDYVNPCGVEGMLETQCKYLLPCGTLAKRTDGKYICKSSLAYVAVQNIAEGSTFKRERSGLIGFLTMVARNGDLCADPLLPSWAPEQLEYASLDAVADDILARAKEMTKKIREQ